MLSTKTVDNAGSDLGVSMATMSDALSLRTVPTSEDTGCQAKLSVCRM